MPIKRAKRRTMGWRHRGKLARTRVPLGSPLHRVKIKPKPSVGTPDDLLQKEREMFKQGWAIVGRRRATDPLTDELERRAHELYGADIRLRWISGNLDGVLTYSLMVRSQAEAISEPEAGKIAGELMDEDMRVWRRMGIRSGNDIYPHIGAPKENWERYQEAVKQMLEQLGYNKSNRVPWQVRDVLENENHHSLNQVLDFTGYGEPSPTYAEGGYGLSREEFFKVR